MKRKYLSYLCAAACLAPMSIHADEIRLTTTAPQSSVKSLALNAGLTATLSWDGGAEQQVSFNGLPQEIKIQGKTLTIKTPNTDDLTSLYASDFGLTEIVFTKAQALSSIDVSYNDLTELNLNAKTLPALAELNCRDNQLESLSLTGMNNVMSLDCANNKLQNLSLSYNRNFKYLNAANNELTEIGTNMLPELSTLWVQGNKLSSLSLTRPTHLTGAYAFDNQLTELKFPTSTSDLSQLWVGQNKLTYLDLNKLKQLKVLSAEDNSLDSLSFAEDIEKTLKGLYLNNNAINFPSLPTMYLGKLALIHNVITPQKPFAMKSIYTIEEVVDLLAGHTKNASGLTLFPSVKFKRVADNSVLASGKDFKTVARGQYQFNNDEQSIFAEVTLPIHYPGVTFYSAPFAITTKTSISNATAQSVGLSIITAPSRLSVHATQSTLLRITDAAGRTHVTENIGVGTYSYPLASGVYIVNGRKVLVP